MIVILHLQVFLDVSRQRGKEEFLDAWVYMAAGSSSGVYPVDLFMSKEETCQTPSDSELGMDWLLLVTAWVRCTTHAT